MCFLLRILPVCCNDPQQYQVLLLLYKLCTNSDNSVLLQVAAETNQLWLVPGFDFPICYTLYTTIRNSLTR